MYCCSWWTIFNSTESNTLKKLPQAHNNHLIDNEMQSLLSLTIQICIFESCFLCNMLLFQRNTLDWTFSQHFEKYRGYSITPKPSTNHQYEDLLPTQNTCSSKTTKNWYVQVLHCSEKALDIFQRFQFFKKDEKHYLKKKTHWSAHQFYLQRGNLLNLELLILLLLQVWIISMTYQGVAGWLRIYKGFLHFWLIPQLLKYKTFPLDSWTLVSIPLQFSELMLKLISPFEGSSQQLLDSFLVLIKLHHSWNKLDT